MSEWLRLVTKWHAPEIVIVLLAALAMVVASLMLASAAQQMAASRPECFPAAAGSGCSEVVGRLQAFQSTSEAWFDTAAPVAFLVGIALGAPLPGRELDTGAGQLVFSVVPSRTRWLLDRLFPLAALTAIAAASLGIAGELLAQPLIQAPPPDGAFSWAGARGVLPVSHALAGLGSAVLAGLLVAQALGAALLGVGICGVIAATADTVRHAWLVSVAFPASAVAPSDGFVISAGDRGSVFVSGTHAAAAASLEAAVYLVAALTCVAAALLILNRRNPS